MFRTLIYPSSGACDCVDEIPHRSSCSQFLVCWSFWCGWFWVVLVLQAEACKTNTTQNQSHQISNTQRTENKTTDVVTQQHSCKLLMMDILMSETCWAHKKWNKIASDIKLVFHSSNFYRILLWSNTKPRDDSSVESSNLFSRWERFCVHETRGLSSVHKMSLLGSSASLFERVWKFTVYLSRISRDSRLNAISH